MSGDGEISMKSFIFSAAAVALAFSQPGQAATIIHGQGKKVTVTTNDAEAASKKAAKDAADAKAEAEVKAAKEANEAKAAADAKRAADTKAAKEAAEAKAAAEAAARAAAEAQAAADAKAAAEAAQAAAAAAAQVAAKAKADKEAAEATEAAAAVVAATAASEKASAKAKHEQQEAAAAERAAAAKNNAEERVKSKAGSINAPESPISFALGTSGQEFTVDYAGYIDSALQEGLGGFGHYRFLGSDDGINWKFGIVEIKNISSAPITASRISVYGFNADPNAEIVTAEGLFNVVRRNQNVPGLGTREVCIKAADAQSCAGGGGLGLAQGASTNWGGFTVQLAQKSNMLTLDNFFIRFQSIEGGSGTSGVGAGVVSPVPEPSQWAMLIAGFLAFGMVLRRRRQPNVAFA
jgi:hypothetical protein